ncbi:LOW QUALITY PROTEIN: hypothetical protein QYF61_021704 [Mycteria americana]|uniref:Reverse transcriptase domain-containing protein n=1 Tax=Mycteria americana TaxID=33587 RepID=A0AAN7NUU1_MYCAM|nr:LOW QUALITY PROTEIN: hypothetical protein QYF61_021704 [Mycteria americana]
MGPGPERLQDVAPLLMEDKADLEFNLARDVRGNKKGLFKYINRKRKTREKVGLLLNETGDLVTNYMEKAEVLKDFFFSVFTVKMGLHNAPETRGRGDLGNCRLVSCTSDPGKQQLILETISNHLKDGKIIENINKVASLTVPLSHCRDSTGLRLCRAEIGLCRYTNPQGIKKIHPSCNPPSGTRQKGKSCLTNLTAFYKEVTLVDEERAVDVVYPDFGKSFDTVSHKILMGKLTKYGLPERTIENWLKLGPGSSKQWHKVWRQVAGRVSQGSMVGPMLFNTLINDLNSGSECTVSGFADDTIPVRVADIPSNCTANQRGLDGLEK